MKYHTYPNTNHFHTTCMTQDETNQKIKQINSLTGKAISHILFTTNKLQLLFPIIMIILINKADVHKKILHNKGCFKKDQALKVKITSF